MSLLRSRRLLDRLPSQPGRALTVAAWVSLAANVVIVATGGAVRLTGSGLGCPTWPLCTADSLVSTPEMGIHGVIEFANRTLTGALGAIALLVILLVVRFRTDRPDLFDLAAAVLAGVVVQAFIGGITVLTGLSPIVVGIHYVASTLMVAACTVFLHRLRRAHSPRRTGRLSRALAAGTVVASTVTIVLGVVTTGAGPHSGDVEAVRNGLDATVLQHLHAAPSYALLVLTIALCVIAARRREPVLRPALALLGVEAAQIAVGVFQANAGLPPLAVGVHMTLAAVLAATVTWTVCVAMEGMAPIGREIAFERAVADLGLRHPDVPVRRVRATLLNEWHLAEREPARVPRSVVEGADEVLARH